MICCWRSASGGAPAAFGGIALVGAERKGDKKEGTENGRGKTCAFMSTSARVKHRCLRSLGRVTQAPDYREPESSDIGSTAVVVRPWALLRRLWRC